MSYHYKTKPLTVVLTLVSAAIDIVFVSWVVMQTWNNVVVDVFDVHDISYTSAIILKFAYSSLTSDWFSSACRTLQNEQRFDDYANMVSTQLDKLKISQTASTQGLNIV